MTTTCDDHDIRIALTDASLDAPRVDIWERINDEVIGLSTPRRPFRRALRSLAAVLAILLTGAGMLTIFSLVDDSPDRRARQIDTVPDLLLLQSFDEQTRLGGLRAFVPESARFLTVLGNATSHTVESGAPLVSRDGALVFYSGWQREDETWILRLWAIESATLDIRWTTEIVSIPVTLESSWPEVYYGTAIAGDRVYIAWHGMEEPLPIPIRAFNAATGDAAGSWDVGGDVDWASMRAGTPWIAISPDGKYLQLMAQVWDDSAISPQPQTAFVSFTLPEMRETQRTILEESVPEDERFYPWNSAFTPDGGTLYTINGGYYDDPLRVDFFETATGAFIGRVDLDFGSAFEISQQTALSHDGTQLYIFDPVSSRLAVVDLVARQLVNSVTIDTSIDQGSSTSLLGRAWNALGDLFIQGATAKINFKGTMQLSPDGSRLYAIDVDGQTSTPRGVLVIETSSWRVVEHWLADQHPIKLILSGDGAYLYALTTAWNNQGRTGLRIFDTGTGDEVVLNDELQETATPYWTYSLVDIYRDTWGVTPTIAGIAPDRLNEGTGTVPHARMDVSVSAETTMAGQPVTVELRYVDPATGEPITEATDSVRFDEPDHVRALISKRNTNAPEQTIVLARSASGIYRGAAVLPGTGAWSIQVVAETEGHPSRYATVQDAVVVQRPLPGTDGRSYTVHVEIIDPPSRPEQPTRIRARIVDADTGEPLPDGVELVGGLPESMDGSATLENRAVTSATLTATGYGVYEGTYTFYAGGNWLISVNFPQDGHRSGGIMVGVALVE